MPPRAYPQSAVLYRGLTRSFPLVTRAEGCWLHDDQGREYLDGVGGAFVATVGHGVAEIAEAMAEQARRVAYLNGTQFTSEPVEALAEELVKRAPDDLAHVLFLTSGSDAVEAALKLARQYWVETGRPGKHKVLGLTPGYHGNTLLALSVSGRPRYQTFFGDWLVPVPRVSAPYPYRCPCGGREPLCGACSAAAVEEAILREGPETVAAFLAEPVGGSSTGATTPREDYWREVRRICDRHEVLWVADEILVGAGRTGTWSALEPYRAAPDLLVLGKGIGGGYSPLAAVLAPRRLLDPIARGSGGVLHAQTFLHHPVNCAAGLAVLRYLDAHGLGERCAKRGAALHARLARLRDLPVVGDVRGRGLLAGIEFVADRETRAPFPREARFAERFADAALAEGLVVWPATGQVDGTAGDLAMLAPPFTVSEAELDELVARFERAVVRTGAG